MSLNYVDPRCVALARKLGADAKLVWMYLITNHYAYVVPGLLVKPSVESFALDFGLDVEQTHRGLIELMDAGLVSFDDDAGLFRIPAMATYLSKPGVNNIRGWHRHWRTMPESPLKYQHLASLRAIAAASKALLDVWEQEFGSEVVMANTGVVVSPQDQLPLPYQVVRTPSEGGGDTPIPIPIPIPSLVLSDSGSNQASPELPDARSQVQEPVQEAALEPVVLQVQERGPSKAEKRDVAWKQVAGEFQERYVEREGVKPTLEGKERKILEPLVQLHGPAEVCRRIEILFTAPPAWLLRDGGSLDVRTLVAHFDKLARPAAPATGPPRAERLTGDDLIAMAAEMRRRESGAT